MSAPTGKEYLWNTVRGQPGSRANAVADCDGPKTDSNISANLRDGTMNVRTLRVVDLDELLEDFPEVLEVMNSTDLPWTFGDCRHSLISGSDLQTFLQGEAEQVERAEEEEEPAEESNHVWEQIALAIQRVANLPRDVLIDL